MKELKIALQSVFTAAKDSSNPPTVSANTLPEEPFIMVAYQTARQMAMKMVRKVDAIVNVVLSFAGIYYIANMGKMGWVTAAS